MSDTELLDIKVIIKDTVNEVLFSNKELLYNIFFEAFEDFNLLDAIKEGESSGIATPEEVFGIL